MAPFAIAVLDVVVDEAEVVPELNGRGAREYTREQAAAYRDRALAELEAAGVVDGESRAYLDQIIRSAISAAVLRPIMSK